MLNLLAVVDVYYQLCMQVEIAAGDNIRTIVKFLNHGQTQEKEKAVSLLYELSENKALSERVGNVSGAILILVGLSSSKVENLLIVDRAEKTLENLESCEKNVRQMAENGRLQPLLRLLLEGTVILYLHVSFSQHKLLCILLQL